MGMTFGALGPVVVMKRSKAAGEVELAV